MERHNLFLCQCRRHQHIIRAQHGRSERPAKEDIEYPSKSLLHVDKMIILHRPEFNYSKVTNLDREKIEVTIAHNTNGSTGSCLLDFHGDRVKLEEVDEISRKK